MMPSQLILFTKKDYVNLDHSVQKEIYQNFYNLSFSVAIYMVKDTNIAEDIVHDVFLKTLLNVPNIKNEHHLINWVKTVTRNTTLNTIKKDKRHLHLEYIEDINRIDFPIINNPVEKKIVNNLLAENIYKLMANIDYNYFELMVLKYKHGKSIKEIAKEKDSTENAIKQKLYRARKILKTKIQKDKLFSD